MTFKNPDNEVVRDILEESSTIAVIGLSDKKERTSYQIAEAMQKSGYKIIPINPTVDTVLGEKSYASIKEVEEKIDIINVFRRSEFLPGIAEEVKDIEALAFWGQQGVEHEDVPKILESNEMTVIMNLCIKVAHSVLLKK